MLNEFIAIRRELHQIPETGYKELKTQAYLLDYISKLPSGHLEVKKWRTGILVLVKGTNPEKTIGYRTDIDALPITEETGAFCFKTSWQYACLWARFTYEYCAWSVDTFCE